MRLPNPRSTPGLSAGLVLALTLGGCAVGPDFERPKAPENAGYSADKLPTVTDSSEGPGGQAQRFVEGMDIPAQWWRVFGSPELNSLIVEALNANADVAVAQASLRQAYELAGVSSASLFPSVTANGAAGRQRFPPSFGGQVLSIDSASLTVSYVPDIFGGVRRQIESADAAAEAQRYVLEATYLTLSANVVNTAVALASLREQIKGTEEIVHAQEAQLEVLNARRRLGAVSNADVLAQQTAIAQTRATLAPLQKQMAQARNQLMALLGRLPNGDRGENFSLDSITLPAELPVSLPSRLVEQRPDVRAAEAQMHQASAAIGVAQAARFPQFGLSASYGTSGPDPSTLLTPGTEVWSWGGTVAQTLFSGGALTHQKSAAEAAFDAASARYRGTVINAFADVANTLRALQFDAEALKAQVAAENAARDSLNLATTQYKLGAVGYPTLLNAQVAYQSTLLARVRAQAIRYSDTAALFQSLGGGWWNRQDASTTDQSDLAQNSPSATPTP